MIDTVFFLLVFFMIAGLSMTMNRGLPVNLPGATSGVQERKENVALTLTRAGEMFLDERPVAPAALGPALSAIRARNPEIVLIVNADADVAHRRVVEVMDEARGAGLSRLAIAVRPEAASR
jgi:biopolymer transport protein ExbD